MLGETDVLTKDVRCTSAIAVANVFGKPGADDHTFSVCSAVTDKILGIFRHTTINANDYVSLALIGIYKLKLGGTVTRGDRLTSDSNGYGIKRTGQDQNVGAVALASGVNGDIIPVFITTEQAMEAFFGRLFETMTVTTDATAGANTWTAAELVGGLMLRDPAGANRSDVTPTAALIVAAIIDCAVGSSFEFSIKNTADADEVITLTAGSGITLNGVMTIEKDEIRRFVAIVTDATASAEAVTIYSLKASHTVFDDRLIDKTVVTANSTASVINYSAVALLGGLMLRDPSGAGRADTVDTAANIVSAIPNCAVGSSFEFTVRNTADADETITLTTNTGITLSGTMTITQNNTKKFKAVVTNVGTPAVTIYSLGTMVH